MASGPLPGPGSKAASGPTDHEAASARSPGPPFEETAFRGPRPPKDDPSGLSESGRPVRQGTGELLARKGRGGLLRHPGKTEDRPARPHRAAGARSSRPGGPDLPAPGTSGTSPGTCRQIASRDRTRQIARADRQIARPHQTDRATRDLCESRDSHRSQTDRESRPHLGFARAGPVSAPARADGGPPLSVDRPAAEPARAGAC